MKIIIPSKESLNRVGGKVFALSKNSSLSGPSCGACGAGACVCSHGPTLVASRFGGACTAGSFAGFGIAL